MIDVYLFENNTRYMDINGRAKTIKQSIMQAHTQKQSLILDQHYANNILFTTMSTIEQIIKIIHGNYQKKFNYYDKYDYNYKNLLELKTQLKLHLTIMKASKKTFNQEHGQSNFKLPTNFNMEKVIQELDSYKAFFMEKKEQDCLEMVQDLKNILLNKLHQLQFQKKNYQPYSISQQKVHEKELFKSGLKAQRAMEEEREKIQKINSLSQEELPVEVRNRGFIGEKKY